MSKTLSVFLKVVGILTVLGLCVGMFIMAGFILSGQKLDIHVASPSGQTVPFGGVISDDSHDWTVPAGASAQNPILPDGAMPLLRSDGTPKGYALILYKEGPARVSRPEGGWTIVTCGNCTVDGVSYLSDGTVGNVILLMGVNPDGSTPADLNETITIDGYTTGHVSVTTIWSTTDEDPEAAVMAAVAGMFKAPACGQEGCLQVYLTTNYPGQPPAGESFTEPPAAIP